MLALWNIIDPSLLKQYTVRHVQKYTYVLGNVEYVLSFGKNMLVPDQLS
jgi:hypothetical protein